MPEGAEAPKWSPEWRLKKKNSKKTGVSEKGQNKSRVLRRGSGSQRKTKTKAWKKKKQKKHHILNKSWVF